MRKWIDLGNRYGEMPEVLDSVLEEVLAIYPESKLPNMVKQAISDKRTYDNEDFYRHVSLDEYHGTNDWKTRLRMLNHFPNPTFEDIPLLDLALSDYKVPIRRQAIVLLGMIESKDILPYLYKGLRDKSPAVRRTAGDCISDLGYPEALPEMVQLLDDPQKKLLDGELLCLSMTKAMPNSFQHLKRILMTVHLKLNYKSRWQYHVLKKGDEALGSVWKQMANRTV